MVLRPQILKYCGNFPQTMTIIVGRAISTTPVCNLRQKWRQERGLPMNPNAYGVLTDSPDYSYLDGRPTPLGSRAKNRVIKQEEIAQKIITLSSEIDFAIERHQKLQTQEEQSRKKILESKLKPKGLELLKKKH